MHSYLEKTKVKSRMLQYYLWWRHLSAPEGQEILSPKVTSVTLSPQEGLLFLYVPLIQSL